MLFFLGLDEIFSPPQWVYRKPTIIYVLRKSKTGCIYKSVNFPSIVMRKTTVTFCSLLTVIYSKTQLPPTYVFVKSLLDLFPHRSFKANIFSAHVIPIRSKFLVLGGIFFILLGRDVGQVGGRVKGKTDKSRFLPFIMALNGFWWYLSGKITPLWSIIYD